MTRFGGQVPECSEAKVTMLSVYFRRVTTLKIDPIKDVDTQADRARPPPSLWEQILRRPEMVLTDHLKTHLLNDKASLGKMDVPLINGSANLTAKPGTCRPSTCVCEFVLSMQTPC